MSEFVRFALLGLGPRRPVLAGIAGPDGDLPRVRRAELRPRRRGCRRRLRALGGQGPARPAGVGRLAGRPATCALLGAFTHVLVMRPLRRASPLARIVATLGILILVQSAAVLRYGARVTTVTSELPREPHPPVRADRHGRPPDPRRHRRGDEHRAVGVLPLQHVRLGHDGRRREPAGGQHDRPLAGPHRHAQLGARLGAGRHGRAS